MGEKKSRPPTCTSGGTALTSLREGRRDAAAFLRELEAPAIVAQHAKTSQRGGVGLAAHRIIDECPMVSVVGGC